MAWAARPLPWPVGYHFPGKILYQLYKRERFVQKRTHCLPLVTRATACLRHSAEIHTCFAGYIIHNIRAIVGPETGLNRPLTL